MKKSWLLLSVLVIAAMIMTACDRVPDGNIIQMFSASAIMYYPEGRNLVIWENKGRSLGVMVDGSDYRLTDPENNSYVIVGKPGKDGMMEFGKPTPLLEFKDVLEENGWYYTYQAFYAGYGIIPDADKDTEGMLIVKSEDMPKFVSQRLWNGTKTELCIWQYPLAGNIVQNMTTGEIAQVFDVITINDVHIHQSLDHGQCLTGYVMVDASDRKIYITQSEPDLSQMNLAYEEAVKLFGVDGVSDAINACNYYSYYMVYDHGITKEQIAQWCGVYTPDMADWK